MGVFEAFESSSEDILLAVVGGYRREHRAPSVSKAGWESLCFEATCTGSALRSHPSRTDLRPLPRADVGCLGAMEDWSRYVLPQAMFWDRVSCTYYVGLTKF